MPEKNYFQTLYDIDITDKAAEKNGLTYMPWASVWAEVKKIFPDANYTVYENEIGRFWFDDGRTGWVKTGVTINGIEHIERLPIMDYRNKAIAADQITSCDANKAVQRSITKACGRHGMSLHIYEGEDLPEAVSELNELNNTNFELATKIAKKSEAAKKLVGETIRKFTPSGNPKKIMSIDVAQQLNAELIKISK